MRLALSITANDCSRIHLQEVKMMDIIIFVRFFRSLYRFQEQKRTEKKNSNRIHKKTNFYGKVQASRTLDSTDKLFLENGYSILIKNRCRTE